MLYVQTARGSAYIPKILGIYERELRHCVEIACAFRPDRIVDIGAAEGYYAVGLARRNPEARVVAFEMEASGRSLLSEMAHLNGVADRVEIRGLAEAEDLNMALGGATHPLVVCDVEGDEASLLDPEKVPGLRDAQLLVELHDFIKPGIGVELETRFSNTHRVSRVWQQPRSSSEFPYSTLFTRLMPRSYLEWSVSEWRPVRMSWLWMEPLSGSPANSATDPRLTFPL